MKATLYPIKIEQPNKNQSSGLAGKCLKEIRRDKSVHNGNCTNQKDPKYHHAWSNTSELKKGGVAQCGHKSSYHCSHATYYGIKGYRNICPIAGLNGTYTQPATLRLYFDPLSKGINSTSNIKSVQISISHRCTGVDVANDKEYDTWGPNFSGFKTYPNREVLTVKFANQKQTINKNPPLSKSKFDTITLTFKKVEYSHLSKGYIDIIYGNNLSSNPGNIYIKNISIEVNYEQGTAYLDGKKSSERMYLSKTKGCKRGIDFTLEAGYKNGSKKIIPSKSPQILQKLDIKKIKIPDGVVITNIDNTNPDKRSIVISAIDNSNTEGVKTIEFGLKGTKLKKKFQFESVYALKPEIIIPKTIRKNTVGDGTENIIVRDGCASQLTVYDGGVTGSSITINLDPTQQKNMITKAESIKLYNWLSTLECGDHTLFFKRDQEPNDQMIKGRVKIIEARYRFYITDNNGNIINSLKLIQNKAANQNVKIVFEKTDELISNPTFTILNPTFGLEEGGVPTSKRVNPNKITWSANKNGEIRNLTIGTYLPGKFDIIVEAPNNCGQKEKKLSVEIEPNHRQYFDEVFVRGDDSTSFDYEYLVALEGDKITEPIYVDSKTIGASYKDIKLCTKKTQLAQLTNINTLPLIIKNNSQNDINNLLIELNTLIENEDGDLEVSTIDWMEEDGMFFNFKEEFKQYNDEGINNIVEVKNLSEDDDFIDEEDVYLNIKKINAGKTVTINIPFGCFIEKEVYLQFLFNGQPIRLYNKEDCSDETDTFTEVLLKVYDSLLTEMSISGNLDILELSDTSCPLKCFKTEEGITYKIKNIDTQTLEDNVRVKIKNDPRLIPYKYKLLGKNPEDISTFNPKITYNNLVNTRKYSIQGSKIKLTTNFSNYQKQNYYKEVDSKGIATMYIQIPNSVGKSYTGKELFETCDVEITSPTQDPYTIRVIDDYTTYYPGDVVPLILELMYQKEVFVNEFDFIPNIKTPGSYDEITIYYKVCNLNKNKGSLKTLFKTDTYNLVENSVEKEILFGQETNLQCYSQLRQIITEQGNYNRLYLSLVNKDRFNKDITIRISEIEGNIKYKYFYSNVDLGEVSIDEEEGDILWTIPYIEKDTTVYGYIDLEAENIGLSSLSIDKEDFLTKLNIEFDRKTCNCGEVDND